MVELHEQQKEKEFIFVDNFTQKATNNTPHKKEGTTIQFIDEDLLYTRRKEQTLSTKKNIS